MHSYKNNNSFAKHAARTALGNNQNIVNVNNNHNNKHVVPTRQPPAVPTHNHNNNQHYPQQNHHSHHQQQDTEIDKIVESVTNATKRLSQISTNTNSSKRKSKNHVGPWKLGRTLGRGSTGRVRLAKHSDTGQLAAVKIVPKSKFQKNDDLDSKDNSTSSPYGIEREIIIMKLISHQNIMALYDVWENKGELYLVLEYVEGGELFDYLIKKGRLQEKEALHYFKQIINGVNYCHQFNICHRDLKPENLLLDKNLNIKIADFGMAALEINSKLLETSCGSPHYASPEIVTGKNYHGSPSDVWSCGIILFALLTGHLPFDDENIRKLLIKVQNGKFIMPNYLSSNAKDLIWKMLKVNPNDRIKIHDILKHPLLTKYDDPKDSNSKMESLNDYYSKIDHLVLNENDLDLDILKSLSILFHGATTNNLRTKLMEKNSNPEKIFYYLLNDYKRKHQVKDRSEIDHQNSKKKIGNGDGLLKKSKSLIKTTITNQDGSTTVNYSEEIITRPVIPVVSNNNTSTTSSSTATTQGINNNNKKIPPSSSAISRKRKSKNLNGQLEIPVSNSYRRGVSFNNKENNNNLTLLSRSSSRKSFTSINEKLKKNLSLLPPLPDVGIDWLNIGEDGTQTSSELAVLCEEIFNYKPSESTRSSPKKSVSPSKKTSTFSPPKRTSPRKQQFITSSPLPKALDQHNEQQQQYHQLSQQSQSIDSPSSSRQISPNKVKKEEDKLHIPRQIGNFEVNKRYSSEPTAAKPKTSTLDPRYKKRGISNDNAELLKRKFGVNLDKRRTSKIYYSKSSTSINLAAIIKNEIDDTPLPDFRVSSSNYNSEMDADADAYSFDSTNQDVSFDFEVPTKTEIATAIHFSNGSNITVPMSTTPQLNNNNVTNTGKFNKDESIFEDVATLQNEDLLKISHSNTSVIKHHKRAISSDQHEFVKPKAPSTDIRGSLYNNPSDIKEENLPMVKIPTFTKKYSILEQDDETKSTILDNSIFADDTIDEYEVPNNNNNPRVTTIFDDEEINSNSNSEEEQGSVKYSPAKAKRQNSQLKRSPLRAMNGDVLRASIVSPRLDQKELIPQRIAPAVPKKDIDDQQPKKANWFTKIFGSLMSSSNSKESKKSNQSTANMKNIKVFHSGKIPLDELKRAIKLILHIRVKEGTLTVLKETSDSVLAKTITSSSLSKPLKFEILFNAEFNEIKLNKLGGSSKLFKKLISAMEFIIENEEISYLETQKQIHQSPIIGGNNEENIFNSNPMEIKV